MFHVKPHMGPEALQNQLGLDADRLERLKTYADLLTRWQAKINLVGPETVPDLWCRHMLDSAQMYALLPKGAHRLADLGSGAGFPGLVLAILGQGDVHLIESDQRKAAFLREVARATATKITLHQTRIEQVEPLGAAVVTARALAPLVKLLPLARRHLAPKGLCLFPKGKNAEDELTEALKESTIAVERVASITDPHASILLIHEVSSGANPV